MQQQNESYDDGATGRTNIDHDLQLLQSTSGSGRSHTQRFRYFRCTKLTCAAAAANRKLSLYTITSTACD